MSSLAVASDILGELASELAQVRQRMARSLACESEAIGALAGYAVEGRGKGLRPALAVLSGRFGDMARQDAVLSLAAALELIHLATLVHDDVVDEADLRRGRPSVRRLWGNRAAVLVGDYYFSSAVSLLEGLRQPDLLFITARLIREMCLGEMDQFVPSDPLSQTEPDYFFRIRRKTALFFESACRMGALAAGVRASWVQSLGAYGENIGMAFQMVDDVLDVIGDPEETGKPLGSDLRQGVLTLPVIRVLQCQGTGGSLAQVLSSECLGENEVQAALALIRREGGVDYTLARASEKVGLALDALRELPPGETRDKLADLAWFMIRRRS